MKMQARQSTSDATTLCDEWYSFRSDWESMAGRYRWLPDEPKSLWGDRKINLRREVVKLFDGRFIPLASKVVALPDFKHSDCPPLEWHFKINPFFNPRDIESWTGTYYRIMAGKRILSWAAEALTPGIDDHYRLGLSTWIVALNVHHIIPQPPCIEWLDWVEVAIEEATNGVADNKKTWEKAREGLLGLMHDGEPYTSLQGLADRIGSTFSCVRSAIEKTSELQKWSKKTPSSSTGMQCLDGVLADSIAQKTEPNPSERLEEEDVDNALSYLWEQATPEQRASIDKMEPADRRELAELAYRDADKEEQIVRHRKASRRRKNQY